MTNAILNSISTKDRLYKLFIQADIHNDELYTTLEDEYKMYRATLRRSIREAKRIYYKRTFDIHKNDIKKNMVCY